MVSFSRHHICEDILIYTNVSWRFFGVYGWLETSQKHNTWSIMKGFSFFEGLMLLGGEFNEVLCSSEIEGGLEGERRAMFEFCELMEEMSLRDIGYSGAWYTWEKGKDLGTRLHERLDRFVANPSWCELFEEVGVQHMA